MLTTPDNELRVKCLEMALEASRQSGKGFAEEADIIQLAQSFYRFAKGQGESAPSDEPKPRIAAVPAA